MPYLGNTAGNRFVASKAATQFSGDGSNTSFTLDHAVGSDEDILVSVDGVIQEPSVAYAVSNGTTLTFTAAPSNNSGNNIFVYYLFRTVGTVSHPSNNALTATNGTFTGDLTVDTDTLKVDTTNDLVGINTATPSNYYADDLVLTVPDEGGMTIVQGTSEQSYLAFADGTSGDARYRGYLSYDHGIDSLYLGTSANVGLKIDANGHITKPLQPCFSAHPSSTQENLSINAYSTINFATERFDKNGDFDGTSTFTAPVTGSYQLSLHLYMLSVDTGASYLQFSIKTSNKEYVQILDPNFSSDLTYYHMSISVVADMDANDTAFVRYFQYQGDAITDVATNSSFSGFLIG